MKIAIVTDSTADISEQESVENNISIIPAIVVIGEDEFEDGRGLSREDFYSQLSTLSSPPTTAAPSIGMFSSLYSKLLNENFDHIISIHVASTLSGLHDAAKIAALGFEKAVTVVNSGQLSMGVGFQVIAAAQAAEKSTTKAGIAPILEVIESVQRRIKVIAMLDTMEQLKRSGRVSWLQAGLGSILRLKLFVELKNGEVLRLGESRTRKNGLIRLSEMLKALGPLEQLSVLHTNAPGDAKTMANQFPLPSGQLPSIRNVTTVIGTHIGVNAVGFAAVRARQP